MNSEAEQGMEPVAETPPARRPCIAIMGEFSAGKSTLCNLLMDTPALPEKVTATRLSPVWMTYGAGPHVRVLLDHSEEEIDLADIAQVPVDGTLYIRLNLQEELLRDCDLIDFPGISDPNMDPDVWGRVLEEADAVLWLTHATQAWRQSEAAVWEMVPEDVQDKSLLIVTRWDKLTNEVDRGRVLGRLKRETVGQFRKILPVSLLKAAQAGDDYDAWAESGAAEMLDAMVELIAELGQPKATDSTPAAMEPAPVQQPMMATNVRQISGFGPSRPKVVAEPAQNVVMPRRVRPSGPSLR
jgi:hypothetical protein